MYPVKYKINSAKVNKTRHIDNDLYHPEETWKISTSNCMSCLPYMYYSSSTKKKIFYLFIPRHSSKTPWDESFRDTNHYCFKDIMCVQGDGKNANIPHTVQDLDSSELSLSLWQLKSVGSLWNKRPSEWNLTLQMFAVQKSAFVKFHLQCL